MSAAWIRRLACAGLAAALVAAAPWLYAEVRQGRARMLARAAEKAMARGDASAAHRACTAATRMAPSEPEALRAMARYLTLQHNPQAISVWQQLLAQQPGHAGDWESYFFAALQLRDRLLAFEALKGFDRAAPTDTVRSRQMRCHLLSTLGNTAAARDHARALVQQGVAAGSWGLFAHGLLLEGTDEDRARARDWLWPHVDAPDLSGLAACTVLARDPRLTAEESTRVQRILRTHADAGIAHRILATSLEVRSQPQDALRLWHELASAQPLPERVQVARWLLDNLGVESADGLLSEPEAYTRADAALVHLDVLGRSGQWEGVRTLLEDPRYPVQAVHRHLYLVRAHEALGVPQRAQVEWKRALAEARRSPPCLIEVANYAAVMGWEERARQACGELILDPATRAHGQFGLRQLQARHGMPPGPVPRASGP